MIEKIFVGGIFLAFLIMFLLFSLSVTKSNECTKKVNSAFNDVPRSISLDIQYNLFGDYCAAVMRSEEIKVVSE